MKYGLVLEGGAMRGLFTAGVLDALLDGEIAFDGIMGVSAGASFGCNFKSGQKGRVLRYNTTYCRDKRYCSLLSLLKTGDLFGAEFCYRTLPESLDPFDWTAYEENPVPFWAVCTELESGAPEAFLCQGEKQRVLDLFRASSSMPLVSRAVDIDKKAYLDGGLSSSIPLSMMEEKGFEKNVVVLTQPRTYVKKKAKALSLVALRYGKDSALYRIMARRHETYLQEREYVFRKEKEGKALILCPDELLPVGRIERDAEKLRYVHRLGYDVALRRIPAMRAFLSK